MRRIAITGHRGLAGDVACRVDGALRSRLRSRAARIVGLSCLADGADTLFARAVLDQGGTLEVVVPAENYRGGLPEHHHAVYDALLARAALVHRLPYLESTADAHMAASEYMIDHADEVIAVWDGAPARGYGGTADAVSYARSADRPVTVVWPEGARRH